MTRMLCLGSLASLMLFVVDAEEEVLVVVMVLVTREVTALTMLGEKDTFRRWEYSSRTSWGIKCLRIGSF